MATPIFDLSSLDGSNGLRIEGAVGADYFGESVNNAGDVNGDGFDDLIIGAVGADPNGKSSGSSYVVFGKASGFDATLNVSTLDGSNGFRLDGEAEIDFSGQPVSGTGDINGDGFDDVIVSAFRNDANGGDSGSSYIVFGRASGFDAALDLSSLDGNNGFRLNGTAGDFLGLSVSSLGDINSDGFDDLNIGSNYTDPQTGQISRVSYTVFGKASGFDATMESSSITGSNGFRQDGSGIDNVGDVNGDGLDDFALGFSVVFGKATGFSTELDVSNLDGNNGFHVPGEQGLSGAGDVNGDGFDDLITANTGTSPNGIPYAGSSYIIFGKASGFDAMLELSSLNGSNGFRMDGEFAYGQAGAARSAAGDINGDGFDDVVIGSVVPYSIGSDANAYVVFGKAAGFNAALQLSNMDINTGIRLDNADSRYLGLSVSDADDINGNGIDDLIVSAPGARYSSNGGISYVVFGNRKKSDIIGTPGDDHLQGTVAAEHFKADAGDDIMSGNGGADIFEGGDGNDAIWVPDLGFDWVFGEAGNDALHLMGRDLDLNLTDYASKLNGIETIDLSGIGDNTLTLTGSDVFNLSDSDTLIVDGDTGDRIIGLSKDWVEDGSDSNYHRYIYKYGAAVMVNRAVSSDFSGINLSDLDGTDGFRLDGAAQGDRLGGSVSTAGDINGDGFDDVIVGAPFADPNGNSSGASYVVFGKASGFDATLNVSGLDGSNGFRLEGTTEDDRLGQSVSNAGDVNGDGVDDLIVGAPSSSSDGLFSGSSYVVFGKTSGFDAALDLSNLDGHNGFRLDGEAAQDISGSSVSNAGDVNGDGFDDLLVSARRFDFNDDDPNVIDATFGSTYVVFGRSSGFDAAMNLSGLNGSDGFRLDVKESDGNVFPQVSSAGDVNGDGFDDVIIGISANDDSKYSYSYVVFGKASGFDATMDLSNLNGSNGFRVEGEGFPKTTRLGSSVSSGGDINGDGFDDVIIGAGYGVNRSGASFVLFGKASGFEATLNVSSLDGANGFRLASSEYSYGYPGGSVSNAGDVNGDGFDDLIVGEPKADSKSDTDTGFSYVVFGKASGFEAVMDVSALDGRNGFRLDGEQGYDLSGASVSGAGDVNGDGFDDLIVGAFAADPNGEYSGSSYVIFGRSDFGGGNQIPTILGTSGDDVLRGTSIAESFEAGDGNDLLIGRGGADVFHGGAGVDQIKVLDLNFASIDGGTGTDILHLDGKDLHLDLASIGDKIQNIETICIYGRGDNTVSLTADSVLNLSDTSNTLILHGNAGDHVTVQDDGWVDGGVKGFYHTYTNDDAVLLIGANLAIEFV